MTRPRSIPLAACVAALSFLLAPAAASAEFGFLPGAEGFDVSMTKAGQPADQAGTHPDQLRLHFALNSEGPYSDGDLRELQFELPQGMLVNPAALDECRQDQFFSPRQSPYEASLSGESCPNASQIGVVAVHSGYGGATTRYFGVFNLAAPYGSAVAIGFSPFGVPVVLSGHLDGEAGLTFTLWNLSQELNIRSLDLTIWGAPWEYKHDVERGNCLNEANPAEFHGEASYWDYSGEKPAFHFGTCFVPLSADYTNEELVFHPRSYLTLPTVCGSQMRWTARASSWQQQGPVEAEVLSRDAEGNPLTVGNCLEILTSAKLQLLSDRAAAATGLAFRLEVNNGGGFLNPEGNVRSPIRESRTLLPEGLTINPSLGAGLGVCTDAEFARESATSLPGSGCPNDSKIGQVSADGLLGLAEPLQGSVFLAKPYENRAHSLVALYVTLFSARRGLFFSSFGTVEPDPATGRLLVTFDNLPPLHYDLFTLTLREGQRAAMIAPPACGAYNADLESRPWSDPDLLLHDSSTFLITHGETGGACPVGGGVPFHPRLEAGSINPNPGSYTPFQLRMTRTDGEQEITSYSATFPPGLLGKIAGISTCSDTALEAAKTRTGLQELQDPSCPSTSQVGHTLAGYGVGGTLAYAPGGLFLAGPYHGAPISLAAVDSALVGPFDLGVVIVRSAIRIDPRTAQASIDSSGSDPIPHILEGIPIHLRDIRVNVDRSGFTVNPTSCDPLETISTLTGSGVSFFDPADDVSASTGDRYQLINCSAYGLKPRLSISLSGGTRRGRYPALRSVYRPRPGDANLKRAVVSLPRSIFLAQEHISDICTMRNFREGSCPPSSRLGFAKAESPLLEEPLKGPVYVRSSADVLPDVVASISGRGVQIEVVGRIDTTRDGGLRATFTSLPDAPVTRFTMTLRGGKRGLLVNAKNLCASPQFAQARLVAHNNSTASLRPRIGVDCSGARKRKRGARR